MFDNEAARTIAAFLCEIGIDVIPSKLDGGTFLPGVRVDRGRLLADEAALAWPGDLLHEAGHLAVAPADARERISDDGADSGIDMGALEVPATAWAYAATLHLRLAPSVLFHAGGYRGQSEGLIRTYSFGVYPGAHKLVEWGMAVRYPHMTRWLR
jgi:hypothetical protein